MLPGLGKIPLAISSKFSNSLASCSAELPTTVFIPLVSSSSLGFTLGAPGGAFGVRRPQADIWPMVPATGTPPYCKVCDKQVSLITPKKGIKIHGHCYRHCYQGLAMRVELQRGDEARNGGIEIELAAEIGTP